MTLKYEPWGDDPIFDWDEENEEKFWAHKITCIEVEDCLWNEHRTVPHPRAHADPEKYGDRFIIEGITNAGRKLLVIVNDLIRVL